MRTYTVTANFGISTPTASRYFTKGESDITDIELGVFIAHMRKCLKENPVPEPRGEGEDRPAKAGA